MAELKRRAFLRFLGLAPAAVAAAPAMSAMDAFAERAKALNVPAPREPSAPYTSREEFENAWTVACCTCVSGPLEMSQFNLNSYKWRD